MSDLSLITNGVDATDVYAFVEEIHMCIATVENEYIGDYSAGQANGDRLIGLRSLSAEQAIDTLKNDIAKNTIGSKIYDYVVTAQFMKGQKRDMIIINVEIFVEHKETVTFTHLIK